MNPTKAKGFYFRSGIFSLLSLVGAGFNYALYPILVRILDPSSFGDFAAIIALSNQVLGLLLAFNVISIYLVKKHGEQGARPHAEVIQKYLIWFFLFTTLLVLVASPILQSALHIESIASFIVLSLILASAVPVAIWTGYLQGHKELVRVGLFNVSAGLAKLIAAASLAVLFGTTGAVGGLFGGVVAGLIVLALYPGVKLPSIRTVFDKTKKSEFKYILSLKAYIFECLAVVGLLTFLQNYDITLAKVLFEPSAAGLYSGISVLSNALYYVAFLLIWVILPEIQINNNPVNRRVLGTGYKLLGLMAVVSITGELILKDHIAQILLGNDFSNQGNILIFATLYQLTLVAITLYGFYLLVNRKRRALLLAALVASVSVVLPYVFANSPIQMIQLLWMSLLIGSILYVCIYGFYSLNKKSRHSVASD